MLASRFSSFRPGELALVARLLAERAHDPHARQRLLQVGGDRGDLLPGGAVGVRRGDPEGEAGDAQHREHRERDQRQLHVQRQQDRRGAQQRQRGREQRDDAVGDQLVQRLDVVGHARDQHARLVARVEADRQLLQVLEDLPAQVLQRALADPAGQVGLGVGGAEVHHRRAQEGDHDPGQRRGVLVADAGVDGAAGQVGGRQRGGRGHHQRDEHEDHAAAVGAQQRQRPCPAASRAAALGAHRRPVRSRAHRPAASRPWSAAATSWGSGAPRWAIWRYRSDCSTSSLVAALGRDPAVLEHDHLVGQRDRGHAVGDHEGGAPLHDLAERLLDPALGGGVHAGGGVVQDQDARARQQRAGDGHALALAAGQRQAALADQRVVAVGQVGHHLGQAGAVGGLLDLLVGGVGAGVGDVLAQRSR